MSFITLGLSEPILRTIAQNGYSEQTPIQKQETPAIHNHINPQSQKSKGSRQTIKLSNTTHMSSHFEKMQMRIC